MNSGLDICRSPHFTYITFRPFHLQPPSCLRHRFNTLPLSVTNKSTLADIWASYSHSRLAEQAGRIEFNLSAYGLVVHLLLLPTSPRGDAVTVDYGPESVCPNRTFTYLIMYACERTVAWVCDPGFNVTRNTIGGHQPLPCKQVWRYTGTISIARSVAESTMPENRMGVNFC